MKLTDSFAAMRWSLLFVNSFSSYRYESVESVSPYLNSLIERRKAGKTSEKRDGNRIHFLRGKE